MPATPNMPLFAKVVLACLLAVAVAEPPISPTNQYGAPSGPSGLSGQYGVPGRFGGQGSQGGYPSGGNDGGKSGNGEDGNSEPANYEFQYDVEAGDYGVRFGHQEARQGEVAQGKYYVLLPDGRTQVVEYVADQDGYRPKISYVGGESGLNGQGYSGGRPGGPASSDNLVGYSNEGSFGGSNNNRGGYSSEGHSQPGGHSNSGSNDLTSSGQEGYTR